jgi:uncharacterized protein YlxW (UPF0749 family)
VTQTTAAPVRDPALSLLDRIAEEALNPAYVQASTQRQARSVSRRPHGPLLTVLTVALVGVLVGVLVVASRGQTQQVASERQGLVALADRARAQVAVLDAQVQQLDADVSRLQDTALANEALGGQRQQQLESLAVTAATIPVTGPGARVVVDDAPDTGTGSDDLGRVLDVDLQQVVNGLWQAGAEAVTVNGQRVGPLTAIRSAEQVVLVNYTPVTPPYEVDAIGDPRTLPTAFLRSDGGQWLQAVQVSAGLQFSIDAVTEDVTLKGQPVGVLRYAEVAGQEDGS